ncbi:MAG: hypothetical protein OJF51_001786 [Nitrospira sp.]|nr:MAG: hypothetical protein OJF51_001786 [Nitrospira sp.]
MKDRMANKFKYCSNDRPGRRILGLDRKTRNEKTPRGEVKQATLPAQTDQTLLNDTLFGQTNGPVAALCLSQPTHR